MPSLTDYLPTDLLQQLQDVFVLVTRARLRIYDTDGEPLTEVSDLSAGGAVETPAVIGLPTPAPAGNGNVSELPIEVEGEPAGRIILEAPSQARWPAEQMEALAGALEIPLSTLRRALQQAPEVDSESSRMAAWMAALMANVITRMCNQQAQLRARLDELATLYRVTALFTAQRDLRQVLDTVAQTVVEVMHVHACSIRLLDQDTAELRIQAVANLSEHYLDKGPILLAESELDKQAFETGELVYVADERSDPRVLYPEEARTEGLVSALIAPMVYRNNPVGAVHVYTNEPHAFSPFETALIKAIVAQAAAAIVNAQLHAETVRAENVRRQLRIAGEVQRRMIPARPPKTSRLDIAAIYVPSLDVSGDLYDFIELPEGNLGLVIADVMGKGIPASLLMASTRASLRAHVVSIYDLSDVLGRVNRSLCDDTLTSDFATLFYGVIDTTSLDLTYSNAGHEPPLLVRDGQIRRLSTGGTVLGIDRTMTYDHDVVGLRPGDVLVLATDGLIEALNFNNEMFGRDRMEQAILSAVARGDDANGIAQHVLWEMRRFAGLQTRPDDVTLVTVRVR